MENLLLDSLLVTVVGMTLLFIALAILYGLMYLMTAVLRDPAPAADESAAEPAAGDRTAVLQAAAIAVALTRAQQEALGAPPVEGEGGGSRWWLLHHIRRLTMQPTRS